MYIKKIILFLIMLTLASQANANPAYMNFDWWKKYNDEILMNHLQTLYVNNHELKIAEYRTKQAQENIHLISSSQLPQVGLDAEFVRTMRGGQTQFGDLVIPTYSQNHFYLPVNASYEIDIWGENHLKKQIAKKQKEMVQEDERAVYLLLTSNFVANYFNLIKANELEKITKQIIEIQKQIVSMTKKKYNLGLAPISELLNETQILVRQEEELTNIISHKDIINNQLATLLGQRNPDKIAHKNFKDINYPNFPESITLTAIQYRPDLKKAEIYAQKVGIDVKVAKRDFFPKIILFGNLGFNAYRWNDMFNNRTFLSNLGITPQLDIFSGGEKLAKFRLNKYEYKKAGELYEQTVLTSMQEVNDALCLAKNTNVNLKKSEDEFEIETQKHILAQKQFKIGDTSKLGELKSEINLLSSEKLYISAKINDVLSTISLYNATGGIDYTNISDL